MSLILIAFWAVLTIRFLGDAVVHNYWMVGILCFWGIAVQWGLKTHFQQERSFFKAEHSLAKLIGIALCLRMCGWGSLPTFSDDLYRYLWEGQLVLQGGNPFVQPPNFFDISDGIREWVNHPSIPSVYPPLAQWIFALISWLYYQPIAMQVVSSIADVGIVFGIYHYCRKKHLSQEFVWLYAIHPLPIIEFGFSGHLESWAIFCVVWAVNCQNTLRVWFLWMGTWIKLFPVTLLLVGIQQVRNRQIVIKMLPILLLWTFILGRYFWDLQMFSGLSQYSNQWEFNSSLFGFLQWIIGWPARRICAVLGVVGICWILWQNWSLTRSWLWIGALFILCSPTVHPWYGFWVWVPALLQQQRIWNTFASLLPLSYIALSTIDPHLGTWSPPLWPTFMIYSIPTMLYLFSKIKTWECC